MYIKKYLYSQGGGKKIKLLYYVLNILIISFMNLKISIDKL